MSKIIVFSLGRKGGSVRYAKKVVDNFSGTDHTVYCSRYCIEEKPLNSTEINTYKNNFEFIYKTSLFIFFLIKLIYILRKHKYIVLYFPYFHYWNYLIIVFFKIFKTTKVISTVHDGILHTGDGLLLEQYLNRKVIQFSDSIIFLTKYVRNKVLKEIGFNGTSFVIPHGIFEINGLVNKPRVLKNKKLLFFGRVNKYKGVEMLVDALNYLPEDSFTSLTIAGKFSYNYSVNSTKIDIIDKWITEAELVAIFNNHDILVIPYTEATQSGVISIGIYSCMPMVVTDVGGLNEQLNKSESIFVKPTSENIARGLKELLENAELYNSLSIRLKQKSETISWKNISNSIFNVISEVK